MSPRDELQIGDQANSEEFGKLTVVGFLGGGGMGQVYEVERPNSTRRYALKTIKPEYVATPEIEKRFRREADVLGRLNNTRIIKLHAYFRSTAPNPGIPCIVMDLLHGIPLSKVVRQNKKTSILDVCTVASDLLGVLDYIHGLEIVHRDVKPDNIFLQTVGGGETLLTLIDFGIFKELSASAERHFVGTPRYSAPEQRGARGSIGPRTDLFAVGVVLYELLSGGKHPYGGVPESIWDDSTPALPLSEVAPGTPQEICEAIMAAVEKDAAKRPESARALAKPFRRFHREATRMQGSANASSSTGGDLLKNLIAAGDDIHALRTDAPNVPEPDPFKGQPAASPRTGVTAIGLAPTTPAPGEAVAAQPPSGAAGTAPLAASDEANAEPPARGLEALAEGAEKEPELASVDGTSATNQFPGTRLRAPLVLSLVAAASLAVTAGTWSVLRARASQTTPTVQSEASTDRIAATAPAAVTAPPPAEARTEAPAPTPSPVAVPSAAPPTASTPPAPSRAEHLRVKPAASSSSSSSTPAADIFAPPPPAADTTARVGFEKDGVKFFLDTDPHPGTASKHAPRASASAQAPQGTP